MSYRYRLFKDGRQTGGRRYTLDELREMGTFMLRDLCVSERIMTRSAGLDPKRLKREELIELLFRYRGKEEELLADDFSEDSVSIIKSLSARAKLAPERLTAPGRLALKRGTPVSEAEDIFLEHGFSGTHFVGIISDGDGAVLAVFEVQENRLTLSPRRVSPSLGAGVYRDLSVLLFDAPSSLRVIRAYNSQRANPAGERDLAAAMARLPILTVEEPGDCGEPLTIDFGAGYTCAASGEPAGMGKAGIRAVVFEGGSRLCPSAAAVRRCVSGEVRFCFGYEAWRLLKQGGCAGGMTFFHSLKRYLFEERTLEVCDADGNAALVSSDALLKGFLEYLVGVAQGEHGVKYKKICFLLPEKRAGLALDRFRALLPDYEVEGVCSESVNSVYDAIARQAGSADAGSARVLAFHCGAGSSSLTSCEYETDNTRVAYRVCLKERYLNGDSSFGGNRLTSLIFMYLKIRVMLSVTGSEEEALDEGFLDAYSLVDQYGGTEKIYERFTALYERAEETVPTRFGRLRESAEYKRQNFYRLWLLAEGLKTAFFSGVPVNTIALPDRFAAISAAHVRTPEGLAERRLDFTVHKDALELLLAPEIYRVVKRLIEPLCDEDGILSGYGIRFTGMSCQLPVFRDALREFTVGRRARVKKGADELKLRALNGAIIRGQMQESGRMIPALEKEEAAIAYSVTTQAHDGSVVRIVSDRDAGREVFGCVTRHAATRRVVFAIRDALGNAAGEREVSLDIRLFEETTYDRLFGAYPAFLPYQGDFDSIGEDEIRLFVYRERDWDFCVLPAARKGGTLSVGEASRFLFDNESPDYFGGWL